MKAKKSFGQNWLRDDFVLGRIVESAEISKSDTVVEVGPGLGTLTGHLLATGAKVLAVEADRDLIPNLQYKFSARSNFSLVLDDILKFDFSTIQSPYKVVANIPYYLTSNLLRTLLELPNKPKSMVLLVQKEVAERILAKPGQMSVLTFSVQYYAKPEFIMEVKKELFEPIPKVDSAVVKIDCYPKPVFEADTKKLFRLVKAGFGEKRKTLRNSLSGGLNITKPACVELLDKASISPQARAQELSLSDWHNLYKETIRQNLI